jgi:uncharacterized protein (TIGR02646 family)
VIRITRPSEPPEVLTIAGVQLTTNQCDAYDANPDGYLCGEETFVFDRRVYGAPEVKRALLEAQNQKCCYCEEKFGATSYGDIEHYRPKTASHQGRGLPKLTPGYYWLANEWTNLLVSCEVCNRGNKRMMFPLRDPETRARSHQDDLTREEPLLINPFLEDPRNHITFHNEVPQPLDEVGRITIETLGLRRSKLDEDRRSVIEQLRLCAQIVAKANQFPEICEALGGIVGDAIRVLESAIRPEARFSSMALDFLAD